MKEAGSAAAVKAKGSSKASEGASDGKKKFEVKKVQHQSCVLPF